MKNKATLLLLFSLLLTSCKSPQTLKQITIIDNQIISIQEKVIDIKDNTNQIKNSVLELKAELKKELENQPNCEIVIEKLDNLNLLDKQVDDLSIKVDDLKLRLDTLKTQSDVVKLTAKAEINEYKHKSNINKIFAYIWFGCFVYFGVLKKFNL